MFDDHFASRYKGHRSVCVNAILIYRQNHNEEYIIPYFNTNTRIQHVLARQQRVQTASRIAALANGHQPTHIMWKLIHV